ncbi:MAG: RDD family protein [Nitrospinota bacterium]|nr:RDD family protein [Nitrospinota bacterium]
MDDDSKLEGGDEFVRRRHTRRALPGELETPRILSRFCALFLDALVVIIISMMIRLLGWLEYIEWVTIPRLAISPALGGSTGTINVDMLAIGMLYFTYFHGKWGQTIGKMIIGLKVVELDGLPITLKKATYRWLFLDGPYLMAPMAFIMLADVELAALAVFVLGCPALLWKLADIILTLVDRAEQKSLHDRLASTRVVVKQ